MSSIQKGQELLSTTIDMLESATENARQVDEILMRLMQQVDQNSADPFLIGLTVFALAVFVGYYVVWKVTPALHSPLMAVTNAISSVIIVGALFAAGPYSDGVSTTFGFLAIILASINIFGGFMVTQRMLEMFSNKK